jgi:transcriptional regulator with XRE-family HTH domain
LPQRNQIVIAFSNCPTIMRLVNERGERMATVNRRYFESLMQAKGLSLRALARRMAISHSQLSLTFSGDRRFQLDEVAQLSAIFGEPISRIVENAGVMVQSFNTSYVPVIGSMGGDGVVSLHDEDVVERTHAIAEAPEDCVAIQARTTGSALDWLDGVVFFMRKPDGFDTAALGRFSLCKIKNGVYCMASIRRGYREDTYNLKGLFEENNSSLVMATPVLFSRW